jgi:hypothetical protein
MPEVKEDQIFNRLLPYRGSARVSIGKAVVSIDLNPIDNHAGDSPDFILVVDTTIRVFGEELRLRIPLPIEAEKGGIDGGAMEDLRKFIEREKHIIEIPMLVVAEAGYGSRELKEKVPVKFSIRQIPVRQTNE